VRRPTADRHFGQTNPMGESPMITMPARYLVENQMRANEAAAAPIVIQSRDAARRGRK
jgi:hypothetical protein